MAEFTKEQLIDRINEALPCFRHCITPHNELQTLKKTIAIYEIALASLEAEPYGYLRENDGQIQISIGPVRPSDRSGGYATPWAAIYTAPNACRAAMLKTDRK